MGNAGLYLIAILMNGSMVMFAYYYFKQVYNNQLLELKNLYLEENLELIKNGLNDYRKCKHNVINDFIFIKTLCDTEAQPLIDKKMRKYYKDYQTLNEITSIPKGFQGLIYTKLKLINKYKIGLVLTSDTLIDYKSLGTKLYIDLCEVVSIALDNAIEATQEADEKAILFEIKETADALCIKIINTFENNVDLDKIGKLNYSTKNRESGIGLHYINKLNKNIKVEKEIIHSLFVLNIYVKIK